MRPPQRRKSRRAIFGWPTCLASALLVSACGGSEPEPAHPEPVEPPLATESAPPPEPESDEAIEAELAAAEQAIGTKTEGRPNIEREILYRATPEGLVIETDGVRFKPRAEPIKKPKGAFGIRVTVEAESLDDDMHALLSPENGPLSFSAKVFDKAGKEIAHHTDHRVGSEQQFISPGGPLTFSREWPSGALKDPLWWGQSVTLYVGLWGLGRAQDPGRPLKKFFVVQMVGGAKSQAVLTPPEFDAKSR